MKSDVSPQSLQIYSEQIGTIFRTNRISSRNDAVIAKDSLIKGDPSILKEYDPLIASYKRILQGLIATPAPQPLYANHMRLVNTLSTIIFIDEAFRKVNVDPLPAIQAVAIFQNTGSALIDELVAIREYMKNANIPFKLE